MKAIVGAPTSPVSPASPTSSVSPASPVGLPWADEPRFRCFGCSPRNPIGLALSLRLLPDGEMATTTVFSEDYASYPGIVHGGIISALADEVMGDLLAVRWGMLAFSVTLRTRMLLPLRVGEPYLTTARITGSGHGVVRTEADITGAGGEVHVMANAAFQPIRSEQARLLMGLDDAEQARLSHYFDHSDHSDHFDHSDHSDHFDLEMGTA
jgi:acyl-coenzyme A thioesterase PaaI-like protein